MQITIIVDGYPLDIPVLNDVLVIVSSPEIAAQTGDRPGNWNIKYRVTHEGIITELEDSDPEDHEIIGELAENHYTTAYQLYRHSPYDTTDDDWVVENA
jgi:hypothetical protein